MTWNRRSRHAEKNVRVTAETNRDERGNLAGCPRPRGREKATSRCRPGHGTVDPALIRLRARLRMPVRQSRNYVPYEVLSPPKTGQRMDRRETACREPPGTRYFRFTPNRGTCRSSRLGGMHFVCRMTGLRRVTLGKGRQKQAIISPTIATLLLCPEFRPSELHRGKAVHA